MSFYAILNQICNLADELRGFEHSCDLENYFDELIWNAEYLRDETVICEDCGRILSDERAFISEYDDGVYCNCCYDENQPDTPIDAYHANKGAFVFKNLDEAYPVYYRGLEVELETELHEDVYEVLRHADPSLFRFEEDGSLCSGFEIITAPMSRLYWNEVGFGELEGLIGDLKEVSNPRAWDSGRCGLHIHFNRSEISRAAQKFLKKFMVENHSFIAKMSGRDSFEYCRRPEYDDYDFYSSGDIYNYSRYLTLNFTSDTVEFRFWRGTLKTKNIYASVQFTEDLIGFAEFAVRCDGFEATEEDFIAYLTANRPELHPFKNERRARWSRHYGENSE